ncbi:phosphomannomutase [Aminobacter sp. AP02]|nr:phosphomannomutase [Aminobacter sp. AP02]
MSGLKFGTSGLRGLVVELDVGVCAAYTTAFLKHIAVLDGERSSGRLLVGYDLRASSPQIAMACIAAAKTFGMTIENCGPLPTPALALRAIALKAPAIMVTGSHIPADRNGLKFYRPDGEIDKADEAGILSFLGVERPPVEVPEHVEIVGHALEAYGARLDGLLGAGALQGWRIGVYQHSSVARDLLVDILTRAGAEVIALGRSDIFVPVDTEALRPEDIAFAEEASTMHRLDALVSTDGDADRPLIADENGHFLRGDTVGLITARFLGADAVVTPVTSNTATELCDMFKKVYRTKVGSPYVIEGMLSACNDDFQRVVGFEANGGVLLGSSLAISGGQLAALPTRDAILPILSVLGMAAKEDMTVSALRRTVPQRFTCSGRIEHVSTETSAPFLQRLLDVDQRRGFFAELGTILDCDNIDGIRVKLSNAEVIHYRASGNAPELRCYAEAASEQRSAQILQWGLRRAENLLRAKEIGHE